MHMLGTRAGENECLMNLGMNAGINECLIGLGRRRGENVRIYVKIISANNPKFPRPGLNVLLNG